MIGLLLKYIEKMLRKVLYFLSIFFLLSLNELKSDYKREKTINKQNPNDELGIGLKGHYIVMEAQYILTAKTNTAPAKIQPIA